MQRAARGPALAFVAVLWLLASCTGDGSQPPADTSTAARPTTPPAINRPLDATAYRDKPCDLVTTDQAGERGLTPAPDLRHEPIDESRCYWRGTSAGKDPILRLWLRPDDQLTQIYRRDPSQAQVWSEFVPVTVAGQPAARSSPMSSRGLYCAVAVGLTESQTVEISQNDMENSCDVVMAVAEMVVHKLGG